MGRPIKHKTEEERLAARRETNRRYREKHKTELAAYDAAYQAAHKEEKKTYRAAHKDELAAYNAAYRAAHKEEKKAYNAAYRAAHKEEIAAYRDAHKTEKAEYWAEYYSTPKGRAINLVNNYKRVDRKSNRGECTITEDWVINNVFSGQVCQYCGESDWTKLGVDRIDNSLPHTPENVVPCCKACNIKKSITPYDEFMRRIGKIA